MKKVIVFWSFDILHEGHKHYLQESKSLGSYLIVIVARDENILKFKGKTPKNDETLFITCYFFIIYFYFFYIGKAFFAPEIYATFTCIDTGYWL